MSKLAYQLTYKRHYPHIQPPGATMFFTFRLANSIPSRVLENLLDEAKRIEAKFEHIADPFERAERVDRERRKALGRWDKLLDSYEGGPHWLQNEKIAEIVSKALHHRDGKVYDLIAYCIMPTHVHLVCTPLLKDDGSYHSISAIMHSLKRYSARQANLLLRREGSFWQHENYDHFIRDEGELRRIVNYILNNPVAAGLVQNREDWHWNWCKWGRKL